MIEVGARTYHNKERKWTKTTGPKVGDGGGVVTKLCLTLATPWTIAHQAPLSMRFFRQEYWSVLPCPPPGDLPDPGIEFRSPALQADSLPTEPPGKFRKLGTEQKQMQAF